MFKYSITIFIICSALNLFAQRWQQRVEYQMEVDFDVHTHLFLGMQRLNYFNNSPDTLTQVFYHLYFNAFQPGSDMDIRNGNMPDPDMRIEQIAHLQPNEEGFLRVNSLVQNGENLSFEANGTILSVVLSEPLYPGKFTTLTMDFAGQVPVQIRRSGRDNAEGISYSMSQWYPKLCVYDVDGWHPDEYIGREFYGDFGDFDVKIKIDKEFIVAATGYLQNGNLIGYGYEDAGVTVPPIYTEKITWHFSATDVHDFVWAADPDYTHTHYQCRDGTVLHFFFQKNAHTEESWMQLPGIMSHVYDFFNARIGQYPYRSFSFIQGGDSGMEYPMATLITGNRSIKSLVGVSVHEVAHSWYHGVLGTNELKYAWMDEGFANYVTILAMTDLYQSGILQGEYMERNFESDYRNYAAIEKLSIEEPMTTHANYFSTNTAYFVAAYAKGCVFLAQLEYLIGTEAIMNALLKYYNSWKFGHPQPQDFMRIAEAESGFVLDWYYENWIGSTKTIDYGVEAVVTENGETAVTLHRHGEIPMPIEIRVWTKRGNEFMFYVPLDLARSSKQFKTQNWSVLGEWQSVDHTYTFTIPLKFSQLASVEIDPSGRMADIDRSDNVILLHSEED